MELRKKTIVLKGPKAETATVKALPKSKKGGSLPQSLLDQQATARKGREGNRRYQANEAHGVQPA